MYELMGPRPQLLAAVILAVAVCALFALQWRAVSSFEDAAIQVLTQASQHGAERVASEIQREFKVPAFNVLERIDHTAVHELRLADIERTVRQQSKYGRFLDRVFVWRLPVGATAEPSVWFYTIDGNGGDGGTQDGFFTDSRLSATILRHAKEFARMRANFALARVTDGSITHDLVYHFLYDLPERLTLRAFLGFTIDEQKLTGEFFPEVIAHEDSYLRPAGFPRLVFSILDDANQEVYRSGPTLLAKYEHEVRFPYLFFDVDIIDSLDPFRPDVRYWRVRTAFEGGSIPGLVKQSSNRQRLWWLLAAFTALGGIVLTIRASARELRLAKLRSDFVASVSHELKTPLAKIQLFADTLKAGRTRSTAKSLEYAEIISGQAQKLGQMIAGLLDFSQIESGSRWYPQEEIDLRPVLQGALRTFEYELQQKGFDVEISLPAQEVPVSGDPEGLQQVFENLIGNAIKYSAHLRQLHLSMEIVKNFANVHVADRGVGIPQKEQRKIFRKFYRARHKDTLSVTGSGLGLAIAQHVVESHGGRITVASRFGEGSTFTVALPISRELPKGESYETGIDY